MKHSNEEMYEILARLRKINEKILPATIELNTQIYNDLYISSINFLKVIIEIQKEFNLDYEVIGDKLSQVATVGDIVEIILEFKATYQND